MPPRLDSAADGLRRAADRLIEATAVAILLALLGTVVLGVVSRALNEPVVWSDELARYLMVWTALLGWSIALRRRSHIRIMLVINLLPAAARRWWEVLLQLCVLGFGVLLTGQGWTLVERNWDIEAVSMPLTASIIYVPLLICGVVTVLQAIAQILEAASDRAPPVPDGGQIL